MEVYVTNVPHQVSEKLLNKELQRPMSSLDINAFSCQKMKKQNSARITFLHKNDGAKFLVHHGQVENGRGRRINLPTTVQLKISNQPIYCVKSKYDPDPYHLRSLEYEVQKAQAHEEKGEDKHYEANEPCRLFDISLISCGVWAYVQDELVFAPRFVQSGLGKLTFGFSALTVTTGSRYIECKYSSIINIAVSGMLYPSITITLDNPPRFSEDKPVDQLLQSLQLTAGSNQKPKEDRMSRDRTAGFDDEHKHISKSCLVYRFEVSSTTFNDQLKSLQQLPHLPEIVRYRTHARTGLIDWMEDMRVLLQKLSIPGDKLPFCVRFQMQKLAQNSYLLPSQVTKLVPTVLEVIQRCGKDTCVAVLRMLLKDLPFAGPQTDAQRFEHVTIMNMLKEYEEQVNSGQANMDFDMSLNYRSSSNVINVFRARVTPTGVSLMGPEPESNNRVLRMYSSNAERFLRVTFGEEDGDFLQYHPSISNEKIYHGAFKSVMSEGIKIAGRRFSFLGFSHSSLRARSCWFMAPFFHDNVLLYNELVIRGLGDFSHIRSPAKCAARIGQAFTDTPTTISLCSAEVKVIPDVTRNGRVFSDGVGTISESVLCRIWDVASKRGMKPTCFQIRHAGAKGMVSLDSRLEDEDVMCLRDSMIKFTGSYTTDIELCGIGYKPIPMFLNKQIIKILEDLGVADDFFLSLQSQAINRLRLISTSAANATSFLKDHSHSVVECFYFSLLMREIGKLKLKFRDDHFLSSLVEMSVFVEMRELKHRARIPVEHGVTIYGIMDETGILDEGQIFCRLEYEPGKPYVLVKKNVIITRSPALHPGDVQIVEAVEVPVDSPLMQLSNCVCFSQKGSRDLPSKLSGGDLDGDIYNLIWDEGAKLRYITAAADYPRAAPIDIGRPVNTNDMTDFFVEFMETDQLGVIATRHQIYADQRPLGTLDPECIQLASSHSVAVDYSKTGIKVDMTKLPRNTNFRPDFMAPGPNAVISKKGEIAFDTEPLSADSPDDARRFRYYESEKILGKLYRNIDERKLFREIQAHQHQKGDDFVMKTLWEHIQNRCSLIQYKHRLDDARVAREIFEDMVLNIMYEYAQHPSRPLTEAEVFIGNILGKTGALNKQQRELSVSMKDQFERDLNWFVNSVQKSNDVLTLVLAMFEVSFEDRGVRKKGERPSSFKYVAASLCIRQLRIDDSMAFDYVVV